MAGCCVTRIEPDDEQRFERFDNPRTGSRESLNIYAQKRKCTDLLFVFLMAVYMLILMIFIGYCMMYGDLDRLVNGIDDCGNVCGKLNVHVPGYPQCFDKDNRDKMILKIDGSSTECVETCNYDNFKLVANRCFRSRHSGIDDSETGQSEDDLRTFMEVLMEDINRCWDVLVYCFIASIVFCIILLALFRFFTGFIVWIIIIKLMLILTVSSLFCWVHGLSSEPDSEIYLYSAIILTVVIVGLLIMILFMRKRIQLVIELIKEAGKAICAVPCILAQPILTFISLALVFFGGLYFTLYISSAGEMVVQSDKVVYIPNALMTITFYMNLFGMAWMLWFIVGCQHFIVAGTVATWYFSRSKKNLLSAQIKSMHHLVTCHLGSIALGSLIIAFVQILKAMARRMRRYNLRLETLLAICCLSYVAEIIKFLGRNAYIQIAMYGHTFCQGGKRSFQLLTNNILNLSAINSVGDFVLFMGKLLVVMATLGFGILLMNQKGPMKSADYEFGIYFMIILLGFLVVHCALTVYEMAIDTLFICFCEDSEQNDGISRPYFMSVGLREFIENSKKAIQ